MSNKLCVKKHLYKILTDKMMAKVHFFIENSKIKRYVIKDCDIIN